MRLVTPSPAACRRVMFGAAAAALAWISNFAAGLGNGTVIVIVEPDSLALQSCLSAADATARDGAIDFAGHVIHADDPNAKVYFDGGHSNWNSAAQQAATLKAAGVTADADGVFTNVSNFEWTNDELYYGQQILAALGDSSLHGQTVTCTTG